MKRKIVSTFLAFLLIMAIIMPAIYAKTAQQRKDELEDQLQDAKEDKKEITTQKNSVLKEIEKLDIQISDYEDEISELNKEINSLEKKISTNETEIKRLEKEYQEKEEAFIERLVAIYQSGETTYLDLLLSADNVVDFISNYYMVEQLAEADQAMMDAIENQQLKIEKAKADLEEEQLEVKQSRSKVQAKSISLNNTKSTKQAKVNSLTAEEKKVQANIDKFNEEIKKAEKEIQEALKNSSGYVGSFSGTLSWPVSTSSLYWNVITSGYGKRDQPTAGASTNHKALDIGVRYVNVYAPADGYVVTASKQSGYGNFIMIKHSNNLYTCYGHLSQYKVSTGQTVKRGQVIAVSGNTGVTTGPHLHFEVRTNGTSASRVNPLNYISNDVYSKLKFW